MSHFGVPGLPAGVNFTSNYMEMYPAFGCVPLLCVQESPSCPCTPIYKAPELSYLLIQVGAMWDKAHCSCEVEKIAKNCM